MKNLASWVLAAQKGDVEAYARIYRQYQEMGIAYAYSLLGNFHDAEDATQDAFVVAYQRISQVRDPARFAAWLRRVVFTHADRVRRKRHPVISLDFEIADTSRITDPALAAEVRETQLRVLDALNAMPAKQRQAVLMCYICGYSSKEVGAFLDVPPSTIRGRLASSRRWMERDVLDLIKQTEFLLVKGSDLITKQIEELMEVGVERISGRDFSVRDTRIGDAFDMHEYWSDLDSCKYNSLPMSLEENQRSIQQQIEDPKFQLLVVVDRNNKVIGDIAVFEDPELADRRHIEFLYNKRIDWAKETMIDAINLICRSLFENEKVTSISKQAIDRNADELAILERLNFSIQAKLKTVEIEDEECTILQYSLSDRAS